MTTELHEFSIFLLEGPLEMTTTEVPNPQATDSKGPWPVRNQAEKQEVSSP